ncbi:WD repeat-containing protein 63 [Phytophthora boehmeriae]|uniref:WD repeat-containing protein 63 n=1 Tax=Phytophthora boehmeriae TaxID=109152 RepID=A0A8T1X4S2_9STRA|nr:WD repeat-containing protein 63 [Phytophthora boehmeriae]
MGAKEPQPAPEGTRPMMISMREMETLGLKTGSGLRETVEYKVFTRAEVLDQIAQVGFMCPFHEFRAEIAKMPAGDDILIVADPTETYGENWLLCLARKAFDSQMELIRRREQERLEALAAQEKEANAAADANDMSKIVYEDKPVMSRPWTSTTARETHEDVEALTIKPSRPLITISVTKMSDELNADYKFSDRDADQCFVEWRQHKDPNYELTRLEQDVGLQGTPPLVDNATQTSWFRSVNSALQYEPVVMDPVQRRTEMDSDKLQAFLARVLPHVERALQQNETLDVFLDPFAHLLEEEDASLGNKNNENTMRELRSFTDLVYSKNKTLPAIDWHPKRHGVVAVAAAANASFSRRLDLLDTVESSFILIWNFVDLIHPQLMLESPQDVLSMRFNPAAPHLVAAGLQNGQVIVWDFSKAEHLLSKVKTTKTSSTSGSGGGGSATSSSASSSSKGGRTDDDSHKQMPPVKPLYVSYIDVSHRRPVADLQWLPAGVEVNNRGHVMASTGADTGVVNQFVTIAADGQIITAANPSGNASNPANAGGGAGAAGRSKPTDGAGGSRNRANQGAGASGSGTAAATNIKQQLVAVGDQIGNLHILEVPRALSRPTSGERATMEAYFKRESERMKAARIATKASGSNEGGATSLRQNRGEDAAGPGAAVANNLASLPSKESEASKTGSAGPDDDVFKQMESEFCRDMNIDTNRTS